MVNKEVMKQLEKTSLQVRLELLRMFSHGKAHHFGGSLSCVELLTALFYYKMDFSKEKMSNPDSDKFIMSKGHSVPTQYVILAMLGVIPMEELKTIKTIGTRLQGHPDINKTPGIIAPTGSLGMGLSYANGIALALRLDGCTANEYIMLGDGEIQEGQVWEAAMTTSHYDLNNICVIVDNNRYQSQGCVDDLMCIQPITEKWEAFGWESVEIDGHNVTEICDALDMVNGKNTKPVAIVANTIKGKGISFLEDTYKYHNYQLTEDEYNMAEKELLEKTRAVS